jgi:hypothetical protein
MSEQRTLVPKVVCIFKCEASNHNSSTKAFHAAHSERQPPVAYNSRPRFKTKLPRCSDAQMLRCSDAQLHAAKCCVLSLTFEFRIS